MKIQELIDEVVDRPVEERALILDSLLRGFNSLESEIDKQWKVVAQRRLNELRSGAVSGVSGEEVFKKIKRRFDE